LRPDHVRTLEDFWVWLDGLIAGSGGWLDGAALVVRPLEPWPDCGPRHWFGMAVEHQSLTFGDGSTLFFSMDVGGDLALTDYSFHYQDSRGQLIWRKCNRIGHEREVGGKLHIHLPDKDDNGRVERFEEVDLEEVLGQVAEALQGGLIF